VRGTCRLTVQAKLVRDGSGCRAVGGAELGQDVRDVHADRLGADEQGLGDLPVGLAQRYQGQHLALTAGQAEVVAGSWRGCQSRQVRQFDPRPAGKGLDLGDEQRGG
jgi:hypothetical protein